MILKQLNLGNKVIGSIPKPCDIKVTDLNNVTNLYHLAKYTEYTDTATNSVNEPILLEDEYTPSKQETDKAYFSCNGTSEVVKSVNLLKSFYVNESASAYAQVLYGMVDLKPSTTYTISFKGASGNMVYMNENLIDSIYPNITCTGSTQTFTFTTKADISESTATQYNSTYGWRFFKNGSANTITPSFTNVMLVSGSTAPTTYTPYFEPYIRNFGVRNLASFSVSGHTINSSGDESSNANYNCTDFIPVEKGKWYSYYSFFTMVDKSSTSTSTIRICGYDSNKEFWEARYSSDLPLNADGVRSYSFLNTDYSYIRVSRRINEVGSNFVEGAYNILPLNIDVPADGNYCVCTSTESINLGTSPLRSGDILYTDGVRKNTRATYTFDGTETWTASSYQPTGYYSALCNLSIPYNTYNSIKYEAKSNTYLLCSNTDLSLDFSNGDWAGLTTASFIDISNGDGKILVRSNKVTSVSEMASYMKGVTIEWETFTDDVSIVTPTAIDNTATTCTDGNNTQSLTKYADMYTLDYGHCKVTIGDDSVNISYYDKLYAKNNKQYWTRSKSALSVSAITSRMLTEDTSDGSFYYQVKVLDIEYSSLPLNTYVSENKIHFLDERGLLTTADLYVAYLNKHTEAIIIYGMYVGTVTSTLTTPSTPTQIEGTVIDVDGTFAGKVYYAKQL